MVAFDTMGFDLLDGQDGDPTKQIHGEANTLHIF